MDDPDVWADFAERFRALDPHLKLRADWWRITEAPERDVPLRTYSIWKVQEGFVSTPLCREFEALARRAGSKIADVNDPRDSLAIWLDAVQKETADTGITGHGFNVSNDGVYTGEHECLEVPRVCEVSADLCRLLESRAIEKDRAARAKQSGNTAAPASSLAVPTQTGKPASGPSPHRVEVDAFLRQCNEISPQRILRRHIWRSVGHSKPRQFEYWQAGNKEKTTHEDNINFGRILRMRPEDFLVLLRQKHLL